MKKTLIFFALIFIYSCTQDKLRKTTNLNVSVTYNNGDVDTFYNIKCLDSVIVLDNGDVCVYVDNHYKTIASNARKFVLIK